MLFTHEIAFQLKVHIFIFSINIEKDIESKHLF